MPIWLLWLLPAYEGGIWTAVLSNEYVARRKTRRLLLHGYATRTHVPILDERLRKAAGTPTKYQAFMARAATAGIRKLANTQALEYGILLGLKRIWRKGPTIDSKVELCI